MKKDTGRLKKFEEALRLSEARYRSLVENIGIGVVLISPDMEILTMNRKMREWFPRIDTAERPICYRSFNDPPRNEICSYCPTHRTLGDGRVHESVTETPAGESFRNYRIISSPVVGPSGHVEAAIEMVEDITENVTLRESLALSEKLYQTIFETTGSGTVIINEDMTLALVNEEFRRIFGYEGEELVGKSWTSFIAPQDMERMVAYHRRRRHDPDGPPGTYECVLVDKKGQERNVLITVSMIPETTKSVASFLDISEIRRLNRDLEEREARYRLLADRVSDVIWILDMNLRLTYVSPSVKKLRGYTPDEAMNQSIDDILTPASLTAAMKAFREELALEESAASEKERIRVLELEMKRKDGSTVWTEIKISFIRDPEGRALGIVGVTRDISERVRATLEIQAAKKELEAKSVYLEETNTALRVLLRNLEKDKQEIQEDVITNVRELILPLLEKARHCHRDDERDSLMDVLENNLNSIVSPFARNLSLKGVHLTPMELKVSNLIRQGKGTKDIACLLNLSVRSVEFHRDNIRKKLDIKGKKVNLQAFLTASS